MKPIILALAALAPVTAIACHSQASQQAVSEARTVSLSVSGMT
jgi:hypothetical protein